MRYCVLSSTPVCDRVALLNQYALNGMTTPTVREYSERVRATARSRSPWDLTERAMELVQELPYVPDPHLEDCYKDVETTAKTGGECKALNILLVSILRRLGIDAEVVWIMQEGKPLNHVASVVHFNQEPFWADASIRGARLGETPYQALERTGAYHIVGGRPAGRALAEGMEWPGSS